MRYYLLIILAGIICACSGKQSNAEVESLNQFVAELEIDISDYKSILFIPLEGCGSCIENGVDFYKNHCENDEVLFVFCTYQPHAYDYLRNNERANVVIDKRNIAIKHRVLSTAPVAYKRENSEFHFLGTATRRFDLSVLL